MAALNACISLSSLSLSLSSSFSSFSSREKKKKKKKKEEGRRRKEGIAFGGRFWGGYVRGYRPGATYNRVLYRYRYRYRYVQVQGQTSDRKYCTKYFEI